MTLFDIIGTIGEFLFVTVILKMIVAHGIADLILKFLKWFLVRTKRQAILYIHFRDKAMNRGHQSDPNDCNEGLCHFKEKKTP